MIDKQLINSFINDPSVPFTHKRSCIKYYYEYLINTNKIDDAKELLIMIKDNKEIFSYCLREKWYLQHKYYYKKKVKVQENNEINEMIKANVNRADSAELQNAA